MAFAHSVRLATDYNDNRRVSANTIYIYISKIHTMQIKNLNRYKITIAVVTAPSLWQGAGRVRRFSHSASSIGEYLRRRYTRIWRPLINLWDRLCHFAYRAVRRQMRGTRLTIRDNQINGRLHCLWKWILIAQRLSLNIELCLNLKRRAKLIAGPPPVPASIRVTGGKMLMEIEFYYNFASRRHSRRAQCNWNDGNNGKT